MNGAELWAVVPVKPLRNTKTRLAAVLSLAERMLFTQRTLQHVLGILTGVGRIGRILVVSREPTLQDIVDQFGVSLYVERTTAGLNPTMMEVTRWIGERAAQLLILPSDLPLVTPADIDRMIDPATPGAICSDRHGKGTNGLRLPTGHPFQFHYGTDSFRQHQHEFEIGSIPYEVVNAPGLMFDVDTPEDYHLLHTMNKPSP